MGCANEKECKKQVQAHSCGVFLGQDSLANLETKITSLNQNIVNNDIDSHYRGGSVKTEIDDNGSIILFKNAVNSNLLSNQSKIKIIQSFDQGLNIGQYLNVEDSSEEFDQRRTKSFDPSGKWKKINEESKEDLNKEDYNEFLTEFMKQSYKKNKKSYNQKLKVGPTQQIRWSCWKTKLLNEEEYQKYFQFKVTNIYEYLLCPYMNKNQGQFYENNMYQIVKDITRTFPEIKFFEDKQMGQDQLKRTLMATSNLFRKVGYCQGMNFIMGMLLLVSGGDESSVFDCFISLSFRPEYMLVGLFENGFPLLRFLEYVFEDLFKTHLNELYLHFKDQEIVNTIWLTKWLMTLYLYSFPLSKCIRIMDYVISTNIFALIYVALEILVQYKEQLLKMDNMDMIHFFSKKMCKVDESSFTQTNLPSLDTVDIEQVISNAQKYQLKNSQIRKLAIECKAYVSEEYAQLVDKVNYQEQDSDSFVQNYASEVSNITFFVEYFTIKDKQEKLKYLEKIKLYYINQEIVKEKKQD
ncbi:rab-GTPase-TBC domain protein (macronuclear) [Tetrahymena thermophila SB210]|uniref:Rab-GTPase-TBC domain protein n=1 Tax=Tetrahymena thermophila (strain SB210) TaxID=312017 RepID=Q22P21_TETTS|nr:rab-GTPase-TBC domain protein [Tetrahymena thermophila SB210]EAR86990.2 rab-GTPase-TBC domain protein [Tetrahymena thermophila SB210]|eukprot:XP_001007235.2 rab-GTPase-TBC domain protein [Tetrahymena thermophila SB210]